MTAVVIGVGNPFRGDDGVGWRVVDLASPRLPPGVVTHRLDGEVARLIEAWTGADIAVVVDAATGPDPPGTVRTTVVEDETVTPVALAAAPRAPGAAPASSHALGVSEAVALGLALDRLPRRLVVVTVTGEHFGEGDDLSPAVERAAAGAAAQVVAALS